MPASKATSRCTSVGSNGGAMHRLPLVYGPRAPNADRTDADHGIHAVQVRRVTGCRRMTRRVRDSGPLTVTGTERDKR